MTRVPRAGQEDDSRVVSQPLTLDKSVRLTLHIRGVSPSARSWTGTMEGCQLDSWKFVPLLCGGSKMFRIDEAAGFS